jgi:DNA ligase (NAD+)
MKTASEEELDGIDGVGPVIGKAFCDYFRDDSNVRKLDHILAEVRIIKNDSDEESKDDLSGKVFVITGSLEHFASRSDLKDILVERGAKVTGSVTSKTTCLINNDIESSSNKNQTAKELGVPIIDEESFLKEYLPGNI